MREPEIQATVGLFGRVSLAIIGIGAFAGGRSFSSSLVHSRVLSDKDLSRLLAGGAVGDLILYPFDRDGHFVADQLAERAVAVTTDQLARFPRVIAVAGGARKAEAIMGLSPRGSSASS
jgi:DNA-binding transcriptional regulator LsrR (DeoR family)